MSDYFPHKIVLASAGTGKTYSLVENYLCAVLGLDDGIIKKPQEILALTFTEKAADEMRIRIAERLTNFLYAHDPLKDLAVSKNITLPSQEEIKKIIRSLVSAQICTFHSFAANFLRQYGQKFFINNNFKILLPFKEDALAKNLFASLLISEIKSENKIIKSLSARFKLESGFLSTGLIDALWRTYGFGAESSVDFTSSTLVKNKKIIFDDFLALKQSINELNAAKLTDTAKKRLPFINESFSSLEDHIETLNENSLAQDFLTLKNALKGNFAPAIRSKVVDGLEKLGVSLLEYFLFDDEEQIVKILQKFHVQFSELKKQNDYFSYADLLINTVDILKKDNDVKTDLSKRFKHILVDEYQDTSPLQQDLILLIASDNKVQNENSIFDQTLLSKQKSLFIVGDKKQSIYGFRGANVKLFDLMMQKMQQQKNLFSLNFLNINRRSHQNILSFINLISRCTLLEQGYSTKEDLLPNTQEQGEIGIWTSKSDDDFPKIAALGIHQFICKKNVQPKEITILVRRIKSAHFIKEELQKYGISSLIVGGEGFFQRQEIVDLLSALKLVVDKTSSLSFAIVLRSPLILLNDNEILSISLFLKSQENTAFNLANIEQHIDELLISDAAKENLHNFCALLTEAHHALCEKDLSFVVDLFLTKTKFLSYYSLGEHKEQIWANIQKLHSLLATSYENPWNLIHDLNRQIKENKKEALAKTQQKDDCVQIMTIHQSKGLEFQTVVLADLESLIPSSKDALLFDEQFSLGLKPKNRPCENFIPQRAEPKYLTKVMKITQKKYLGEQQEQARLLYVAMTRAKKNLFFAVSKNSLEQKSSRKSMFNLVLKAKKHEEVQFNELCKIHELEEENELSLVKDKALEEKSFKNYTHHTGIKRYFCSQLMPQNIQLGDFLHSMPDITPHNLKVNGTMAHTILAIAAENLMGFNDPNEAIIKNLVQAAICTMEKKVSKDTTAASIITLKQIACILKDAQQIYCEMHLLTKPHPGILVEGFADMVLDMPTFVGVLDFKSSPSQLYAPETFMQIFAYAHALKERFNKPIKFAPYYIGSDKEPNWQIYDDACEKFFLNNLLKLSKS